jgi:hypothetical protein
MKTKSCSLLVGLRESCTLYHYIAPDLQNPAARGRAISPMLAGYSAAKIG